MCIDFAAWPSGDLAAKPALSASDIRRVASCTVMVKKSAAFLNCNLLLFLSKFFMYFTKDLRKGEHKGVGTNPLLPSALATNQTKISYPKPLKI